MTYTGTMAMPTTSLILPQNAVIMQEEEMRYVEGGKIKCSRLAPIIDAGICLASLGLGGIANFGTAVGKHAIKKNWPKIVKAISKILANVGAGGTLTQGVLNAVNAGNSWLRWASIGGICAYGIDLCEKGSKKKNGWVGA